MNQPETGFSFGRYGFFALAVATAFLYPLVYSARDVLGDEKPSREITKVTMRASMGAATEYELTTGVVIDPRMAGAALPFTVPGLTGTGTPNSWNEYFVATLFQHDRCRKAMMSLGKDNLADTDGNGFLEILDGWGNPMIYAYVVSHQDWFKYDDFLPEWRGPFLSSPGPDGVYGNAKALKRAGSDCDDIQSFALD